MAKFSHGHHFGQVTRVTQGVYPHAHKNCATSKGTGRSCRSEDYMALSGQVSTFFLSCRYAFIRCLSTSRQADRIVGRRNVHLTEQAEYRRHGMRTLLLQSLPKRRVADSEVAV